MNWMHHTDEVGTVESPGTCTCPLSPRCAAAPVAIELMARIAALVAAAIRPKANRSPIGSLSVRIAAGIRPDPRLVKGPMGLLPD